jgi:hypothetical protein
MHKTLSSERDAGARPPRAAGDFSRFDDETRRLMQQAQALLGATPPQEPARRLARSVESAGYTAGEHDAALKALRELNKSREERRVASAELVLAEQGVKSAMVNHAMRGVRRRETKKAAKGHRLRWPDRMRPRRAPYPNRDLTLLTERDAAELARRARNYAPADLANPGERARFADPGPISGYSRVAAAEARVARELGRRAQPFRPERVPKQKAQRERDDVCPECNVVFSLAGWCECERTEPVKAPPATIYVKVRKTRPRPSAPFDDETMALLAQARAMLAQ